MRNHFSAIQADHELKQRTLERAKKKNGKKVFISSFSAAAAVLAAVIAGIAVFTPSLTPNTADSGNVPPEDLSYESGISKEEIYGAPNADSILSDDSAFPETEAEQPIGTSKPNSQEPTKMTAGMLDDNFYFQQWLERKNSHEFDAYGLKADRRFAVKVTGKDGTPLAFISVTLTDEQGSLLYSAVTDIHGNAYLFYEYNQTIQGTPARIHVQGFGQKAETAVAADQNEYTISLNAAPSIPEQLDILFMIDTTGSMGDELDYLKEEAAQMLTELTLRYKTKISINFYRDEGDEYVVKSNPFTSHTEEAVQQLRQETVSGGGDYPEAVEKALENTIFEHQWREDSVKIAFFVLDAPAHESAAVSESLLKSIQAASEKGIRLIPVMASGADEKTEILCRQLALFTGGQFVFITDHSGIGNAHREPITTVAYEVKPLITILKEVIYAYTKVD